MKNNLDLEWNGAAGAPRVLRDAGPWTWFISEAWQQAAAPDLYMPAARRPSDDPTQNPAATPEHATWIAYWSPLLHLTTFALGWATPGLGLWKWQQMGSPTTDPVLATLAQRYGQDDIQLIRAWLGSAPGGQRRISAFEDPLSTPVPTPVDLKREDEAVRARPSYQALFEGGSDPLHLTGHLAPPRDPEDAKPVARKVETTLGGEPVHYLLIGEYYPSLFWALHDGAVPSTTAGRSTRVGLLCPAIGWLGNYRKSRATGLWFRGRHRWHTMGNPT